MLKYLTFESAFSFKKYKVRVFVHCITYNKKLINIKNELSSKSPILDQIRLKPHIELWVAQCMTYIYQGLWCSLLLWKLHFFYNIFDFFESQKLRKLWIILCQLPTWHLFESFHGLFSSKTLMIWHRKRWFWQLYLSKSDWKISLFCKKKTLQIPNLWRHEESSWRFVPKCNEIVQFL